MSRECQELHRPVSSSESFDDRGSDKIKGKQHKKKTSCDAVLPEKNSESANFKKKKFKKGNIPSHKVQEESRSMDEGCRGSVILQDVETTSGLVDGGCLERTSSNFKEKKHKRRKHQDLQDKSQPHDEMCGIREMSRVSECCSQSVDRVLSETARKRKSKPNAVISESPSTGKQPRMEREEEAAGTRSVTCNHSTAKAGQNSSCPANAEHAQNVTGARGMRKFTRVRRKEPDKTEATLISDEIHQCMFSRISKDEEEAFKARGIKIRKGKWTLLETELLKSNLDEFLKFHELSDSTPLLFPSTLPEYEAKEMRDFIKRSQFWKELGKGIHRELFLVYRKAKRLFDPCNYGGRFSEEEIRKLQRLHAIYGRDWSKIGKILERTSLSCRRNVLLQEGKHKLSKGRWTDEETELLREAVRTVTATTEGQEVDISWNAVATFVKTRGAEQCRRRWLENSTLNCEEVSHWTKEDEYKFIERLYQEPVSEECDVNWLEITKEFSNARSPHWLRSKWYRLKKNVPDYSYRSFEDIIDHLHSVYAPTLNTSMSRENV